ncbi:hypothetical protein SDC9_67610 [bioreactor metagenome]|uniref:Uncharacterized protein n=1 Tax=bioreactor metagenome TaxID=1076179 RepID=A0A644XZ47_9ZZZZ
MAEHPVPAGRAGQVAGAVVRELQRGGRQGEADLPLVYVARHMVKPMREQVIPQPVQIREVPALGLRAEVQIAKGVFAQKNREPQHARKVGIPIIISPYFLNMSQRNRNLVSGA